MNRRKSVFMITAGILIGTLAAGPAAHAAESFLQAYPSSHRFFLDGQQVQMEAYTINGNNYVKLADVGKVLDFNVYWDGETGTVQIESDTPYTGHAPEPVSPFDQARQEVVALVNQVRRENGATELAVDDRLMTAAQVCSDRHYTWHHNREECEAVADTGYPHGFGSNLTVFTGAATADIAQRAVTNWENSPGHLRTMLTADSDSIGVGVTVQDGVTYCYLFVGCPNTVNPYG